DSGEGASTFSKREVPFMNCFKWVLGTLVVLVLGRTPLTAAEWDDPKLSAKQQKYLKEFQAKLEARPNNPNENEAEKYLQNAKDGLKQLFAVNNNPSAQAADVLATTLVQGINTGQISVQQSVQLSKELSKVLDLKEINYQGTNQFVRAIEPLVNQTGLTGQEKLRLYREVLVVV